MPPSPPRSAVHCAGLKTSSPQATKPLMPAELRLLAVPQRHVRVSRARARAGARDPRHAASRRHRSAEHSRRRTVTRKSPRCRSTPTATACAIATSCFASGGAAGFGVGPIVVARSQRDVGGRIAIPGERTTAALLLRQLGRFETVVMRFDQIEDAVLRGDADCGVLIHEGRFTYEAKGLTLLTDLGEVWEAADALPAAARGDRDSARPAPHARAGDRSRRFAPASNTPSRIPMRAGTTWPRTRRKWIPT